MRTKIEIGFARTATVAQVNFVLDAIGGRIVNAIAGVTVVTVRIPDPGSLVALEAIVARTRTLPAVTTVSLVLVREQEALPETHIPAFTGPGHDRSPDRRPRAGGVERRRGAESAAASRSWSWRTIFGGGPPNAAVDVGMVASDFSNDGVQDHGYHVLATILGRFASVSSLFAGPNEVVGLFPRRVDARIVDVQATALPDGTAVDNAVLRMVRDLPRRVVLNSSTGLEVPLSATTIAPLAISWITKVRTAGAGGSSLEGKFLHVKAAGNDGSVLAALASDAGAAALLANLVDGSGAPVSNLTNTLLVENVLNTANEPFEPGCRKDTSNVGGTIAAVGTAVFSLVDQGAERRQPERHVDGNTAGRGVGDLPVDARRVAHAAAGHGPSPRHRTPRRRADGSTVQHDCLGHGAGDRRLRCRALGRRRPGGTTRAPDAARRRRHRGRGDTRRDVRRARRPALSR